MNPQIREARRGSLGRSSTLLMLASTLLWGVLPVVFVLAGASTATSSLGFVAVLNLAGAFTAFLLYVGVTRLRHRHDKHHFLSFVRERPLHGVLLFADGALIAVSNSLFVWALSRQEDILVTLIVESWPILAALLLARHVSRFKHLGISQFLIGLIAVVGLYFLISSDTGLGFRGFDSLALAAAAFAALTQAGTVVVHQQLLHLYRPDSSDLSKNFLFQTSRMAVASLVSLLLLLPLLVATGDAVNVDSLTGPIAEQSGLAVTGGVIIVLSALLYARSLQLTDRPTKTLLWFLAPLVSIAGLTLITNSTLSTRILLGGTLIITANILLDKKVEPSWTLASLVVGATTCGLVVLALPGQSEPRYFDHLQVLAAFYAIMQGFLLNRLWDRRRRIASLERAQEIVASLPESEREAKLSQASFSDYVAYVDSDTNLDRLKMEISNFSEVLLLSLLGAATAMIAIVARPDTLLGALNAFLIPVTVIYLLSLTWALAMNRLHVPKIDSDEERIDALLNYGSAIVIFIAFFAAVVATY